jgi:hypothetical protein
MDGKATVEFAEGGMFRNASFSGNVGLGDLGAELADAGLRLDQNMFELEGSFDYDNEGSISATFRAGGEGLRVEDTKAERQLLVADNISIGESIFNGVDFVDVSSAEFDGVRILERAEQNEEDSPSHIVNASKLEIQGIGISNGTGIAIQKIAFQGIEGFIERDKEGELDILQWAKKRGIYPSGEVGEEPAEESRVENGASSGDYTVRVEQIDVSGKSGIVIRDEAISPAFEMALSPIEMHIGPLDTAEPQQKTTVALNAKVGKYASVQLEGDVRPFEQPPSLKLTGKLEAVELQKLSAYFEEQIGYRATQGQLDVDMQIALEENILDSDMKILLVKLKMEPVEGKSELFSKLYDISLDKAVSLLRDKQGNLRLRITVHGDVADPDFEVRDVLRQALGKAIKKGATAYFAPIGVTLLTGVTLPPGTLFLVKKLLSLATTLRFDPVEYDPMEFELNETNRAYLDKMSELLMDRPNVQVAICGLATLADLRALREDVHEDTEREEDSGKGVDKEADEEVIEPPSEEEIEQLIAIAGQRAEGVKDYLVSKGGIDAKRLILCNPDIELNAKSPPRVEMGI